MLYIVLTELPNDVMLKGHDTILSTGTSDEHISVVEGLKQLQPDGAVLVTTPQVG